jgi:hypothetical protein
MQNGDSSLPKTAGPQVQDGARKAAKPDAESAPLYYAKDGLVWKRPVETKRENGTTTVSIGFPVCRMHDAAEGQEGVVAELMNRGDRLDAAVSQLESTLNTLGLMADAYPLGSATRNTLEEECAAIRAALKTASPNGTEK